jgi:hypothetical protein
MSFGEDEDEEYYDDDENPIFNDQRSSKVPRAAYTKPSTPPSTKVNGRYEAGNVQITGDWADDGDGYGGGGSVGPPATEMETVWESDAGDDGWPADAPPLGPDGWPVGTPAMPADKNNDAEPTEVAMCPEHGAVCSRGICKWRAAKKSEEERKKRWDEKEKLREAARAKMRKKSGKSQGKGFHSLSRRRSITDIETQAEKQAQT